MSGAVRCGTLVWMLLAVAIVVPPSARAQEAAQAKSLDELLEMVRENRLREQKENRARESRFREARDEQKKLLAQAKSTLRTEQARSESLEATFNSNEQQLAQLEVQLRERLGALGELFGVVRTVAGDARALVADSLVTAQNPERGAFLGELAQSKKLPSIESLRALWFVLQEEATESGKVVRFSASVVGADGARAEQPVIRVGTFNAIAEGQYLKLDRERPLLVELGRQPPPQHTASTRALFAAQSGFRSFSMDPSRGQILSLFLQMPSFAERVQQGKTIGYVIIALAAIGVLLAVFQWLYLFAQRRAIGSQLSSEQASPTNALGRVLSVFDANRADDTETLELKLDEAILKETPRLERFLTTIRVLSVVAPLLGLLGTVTGMIQTFQAITLFGTGDPKLMAGGISEALVTTMLGLYAAIPLTLLHSFVASRSRAIRHILDEQSAGIVARQAESKRAAA